MRAHKRQLPWSKKIVPLPRKILTKAVIASSPKHLNKIFRVVFPIWLAVRLAWQPTCESHPAFVDPVKGHVLSWRECADPKRFLSAEIFWQSRREMVVIHIRENCQRCSWPATGGLLKTELPTKWSFELTCPHLVFASSKVDCIWWSGSSICAPRILKQARPNFFQPALQYPWRGHFSSPFGILGCSCL